MKPASKFVLTSLCALPMTAVLAACGDSNPQGVDQAPFRDGWTVEHEGDFTLLDDENNPRITNITIGTPDPFGDNFFNRGDIIVEFTNEDEEIKIEMRRFTFAASENAAEADVYPKLKLWAYNANQSAPKRPEDMEEEADCTDDAEGWLDDCAIYVYYEGLSQLERAGADIRVTLPAAYRQSVTVLGTDNLREDSYPNHADVCINNLNANGEVVLENGVAWVKMADDITPAPSCPAELYRDCTAVDEEGTVANLEGLWSSECACAQQMAMGSVSIEAAEPYSANITVDAPANLWTSITAENQAGGGDLECPVEYSDFEDVFVPNEAQFDPNEPWRVLGDTNVPSDVALAGGGFALKLISAGCNPVASVESPSDWDPNVEDPPTETRGNITICSGCLPSNPCDELPGA